MKRPDPDPQDTPAADDLPAAQADARLERAMGAWRAQAEEDVQQAREESTAAEREAAFAVLARELPARRAPRSWWPLAAAVLALALGAAWFARRGDEPDRAWPGQWLGSSALSQLAPSGRVGGYDRFSWSCSAPSASLYGLRVWNAGERDPAIAVDGLAQTWYAPTDAERARLGPNLQWQVLLQTSEGRTLDSAEASVESSAH